MKTLINLITCLLVYLFFYGSLYAQDSEKAWDYFNNEQYELAVKEFEQTIINIENEFGKDSTYAQVCLLTAMSYEELHDVEKTIYYYGLCYDTYRSFPNWETESIYIFCLNKLPELYESIEEYEKALPLYEEVIGNINHNINQNFAFLSENEKEAYLKTVDYNFEKFNSFALQNKIKASDITNNVYNNTLTNKGVLLNLQQPCELLY